VVRFLFFLVHTIPILAKLELIYFYTYFSETLQGRTCATDVKISTMSLLTGLHMNQVVEFLCQMKIATASRATFYRFQQLYVNKIIWEFWTQMRGVLIEQLKHCGTGLTLTGDGQA
jgi:hypothetical protein